MADAERVWAVARWVDYEKHHPPAGVGWKKLVKQTGKPEGEAYYLPAITREEQQRMEMSCITPDRMFREIRHKRMYFMDMGRIIGASSGEETTYLYVEYLTSGEVHGRPITATALRIKGAAL